MNMFDFNPERVAQYEVDGWKAYYDHAWPKLLKLIVSLSQEQFHIPFPLSLLAAYYITRASIAWVPADHDLDKVRAYNNKFYRLARHFSGLSFDTQRIAALETQYWVDHRELVGNPDKTRFIDTLTELHSAIFGLYRDQARESAELRVMANNVLDTITGHTSTDPRRDWQVCEDYLRRCYKSIRTQLHSIKRQP